MREYRVAYTFSKQKSILEIDKPLYKCIKNNIGCWAADPFIVEYQGDIYIFAEVWQQCRNKGAIGYCKYDFKKARFGKWKIVINEPYHLSYPCIYEFNNEFWMCPESGNAEEIGFYECIEFPNKWKKVKVIYQEGQYVDTTYFRVNNNAYAMTLKIEKEQELLQIFELDEEGDVVNIYSNIVNDSKLARPGGKIVKEEGKLYRIGQIGEPHYGSGLLIAEFELKNGIYNEMIKKKFKYSDFNIQGTSNGKITGVHTYNMENSIAVIDVQMEKWSWISCYYMLLRKLKKILMKV